MSRAVGYWAHFVKPSAKQKLATEVYKIMVMEGGHRWTGEIESALTVHGMTSPWTEQTIHGRQSFLDKFKEACMLRQLTNCFEDAFNSSKGEIYTLLSSKMSPCTLPHHYEELTVSSANDISRFRCGNHFLRTETGRWDNTPPDERHCPFPNCRPTEQEDEYHFLFKCHAFTDIRPECFFDYMSDNRLSSVADLLSTSSRRDVYRIARYLRVAGKQRRDYYGVNRA